MTCASPPAKSCAGSSTLRTYSSPGTCSAGLCSYSHADEACPNGCQAGECSPPNLLPPEACAAGSETRFGCANAMTINRTTAGALSGYIASPTLCSAGNGNFSDLTSCTDGGNDHTYRIYLRAGETMTVTHETGQGCLGGLWYGVLKILAGTCCSSGACSSMMLCKTGFTSTSNGYTATADGWHYVILDSPDKGIYKLTVKLTCKVAGCDCP